VIEIMGLGKAFPGRKGQEPVQALFDVNLTVREGIDGLWVGERVAFSQEWTPSGPRATDIHHEFSE